MPSASSYRGFYGSVAALAERLPMPTESPATVPAVDNSRYCVLSLEQVDALSDHARRIRLYGTLVWNVLDSYAQKDQILEGLHELVCQTIDHAEGIETLLEQGEDAAKGGR